jgi:hypothetical protein
MCFELYISGLSEEARAAVMEHRQILLRMTMSKMRLRCLWNGWASWRELVDHLRRSEQASRRAMKLWLHQALHRGFNGWRNQVSERKHNRFVVKRSILRIQRGALHRGFQAWQAKVLAKLELKKKMQLLGVRLKYGWLRVAWQHWVRCDVIQQKHMARRELFEAQDLTVRQRKHYEETQRHAQLKLCVVYYRARWKRLAYRQWKARVSIFRAAAQTRVRALARVRMRREAKSFSTWRSVVRNTVQNRMRSLAAERDSRRRIQIQTSLLRRWRHRIVFKGFHRWCDYALSRRRLRGYIVRVQYRSVARCWSTWDAFTQARARLRKQMVHVMHAWQERSLSKGVRRWREQTRTIALLETQKEIQSQRIASLIFRMQHSTASKALNAWVEAVRISRLLKRGVRKWTQGLIARAFFSWQDFVETRVVLRKRMSICVSRWIQQVSTRAWRKWLKFLGWSRLQSLELNKVASEDELQQEVQRLLLRRTLARMINRQLSLALSTWKHTTERLQALQRLQIKVAARFRHREKWKALQRWQEYVEELQRQRALLAKTMGWWQHRLLARVYARWYRCAEERAAARSIVCSILSRKYRVQTSWKTARSFRRWKDACAASRLADMDEESRKKVLAQKARTVRRVLARMRQRQISLALAKWNNVTEILVNTERAWRRAGSHWKKLRAAKAMLTWKSKVREVVRQRRLLDRTVRSWRRRRLAGVLRGWNKFMDRKANSRALMSRTLLRATRSRLSSGWRSWRLFVYAEEAARVKHNDESNIEQAKTRSLGRTLKRAKHRSLYSGFRSWMSATTESRRLEVIARKIAQRFQNMTLWRFFAQWQYTCHEQKRLRSLLQRSLARFQHRVLGTAWTGWTDKVQKRAAARSILRQMLQRKYRANDGQRLGKGFRVWKDLNTAMIINGLDEATRKAIFERKQAMLRGTFMRMVHAFLSRAWRTWTDVTAELKQKQDKFQHAASHWLRSQLAAAFHCWEYRVASRTYERRVVQKCLARMRRGCIVRCFDRWGGAGENSFVGERRRLRSRVCQMVSRWTRLQLGKGFHTWARWTQDEYHRILLQKSIASLEEQKDVSLHETLRMCGIKVKLRCVGRGGGGQWFFPAFHLPYRTSF